jgi:hypothetical protein
MPSSPPFVDLGTRSLDTAQIYREALPIAALVGLFGGIALVPLALVFLFAGAGALGAILAVVAQFVLAVGAGVVLLYVVVRGQQLAEMQSSD